MCLCSFQQFTLNNKYEHIYSTMHSISPDAQMASLVFLQNAIYLLGGTKLNHFLWPRAHITATRRTHQVLHQLRATVFSSRARIVCVHTLRARSPSSYILRAASHSRRDHPRHILYIVYQLFRKTNSVDDGYAVLAFLISSTEHHFEFGCVFDVRWGATYACAAHTMWRAHYLRIIYWLLYKCRAAGLRAKQLFIMCTAHHQDATRRAIL